MLKMDEKTKDALLAAIGTGDSSKLSAGDFESLRSDPANWTPLMKQYNELVQNEEKLKLAVITQMGQMIEKQVAPTWRNFTKTRTWISLDINLTEKNRQTYQTVWRDAYKLLMEMPDDTVAAVPTDGNPSVPTADGPSDATVPAEAPKVDAPGGDREQGGGVVDLEGHGAPDKRSDSPGDSGGGSDQGPVGG